MVGLKKFLFYVWGEDKGRDVPYVTVIFNQLQISKKVYHSFVWETHSPTDTRRKSIMYPQAQTSNTLPAQKSDTFY